MGCLSNFRTVWQTIRPTALIDFLRCPQGLRQTKQTAGAQPKPGPRAREKGPNQQQSSEGTNGSDSSAQASNQTTPGKLAPVTEPPLRPCNTGTPTLPAAPHAPQVTEVKETAPYPDPEFSVQFIPTFYSRSRPRAFCAGGGQSSCKSTWPWSRLRPENGSRGSRPYSWDVCRMFAQYHTPSLPQPYHPQFPTVLLPYTKCYKLFLP